MSNSPAFFSIQYLSGVHYVGSQISEVSPRYNLGNKLSRLVKTFGHAPARQPYGCVTTASTTACLGISDRSVDYVSTDPPFGENTYYADLDFLVESWHGVLTNAAPEAIVDHFKGKGLPEYQRLMQRCFEEYRRVLKPGRWYVPDPNKAADVEMRRTRTLLRDFDEYRESPQRRLKLFRLEAIRTGFFKAYRDRDYATIIAVAEKIPEAVLRENQKLLLWYDQAVTRTRSDA